MHFSKFLTEYTPYMRIKYLASYIKFEKDPRLVNN